LQMKEIFADRFFADGFLQTKFLQMAFSFLQTIFADGFPKIPNPGKNAIFTLTLQRFNASTL
jgi:hypothetical protein